MPVIKTNRGLEWNYNSQGEGEAVLFIHGFGVSSQLWIGQLEHFKSLYRVITVDLPGHGKSGWQPVTLSQMASDIGFVLDQIGVAQVNVVGSSFGGLVGLYLLKVDPWRVSRLSFVGSLPRFAKAENYHAGLDIERIRNMSQQFQGDYQSILEIFFRSLFSPQDRQSVRFKWIKQFHKSDAVPQREALIHFLDILQKEDARDVMSHINCRVQFINGTEDYIVPVEAMQWMEEMLPHANFDYIKGAGHLPFLTRPEEFNELLEGFLTS
ncbi:MAG: alpha/beta hydrolase [Candidatus Omnitrophica bacterium]|nr:alpha/beta hydrolase [Candidatus Omnitrophota bacterium]